VTLACLRIGAVLLPCSDQLRAKDIALRLRRARPDLVICAPRNRAAVDAAEPECPVLDVPSLRRLITAGEARGVPFLGYELTRELQDYVKAETAPYKCPRRIRFTAELPKTTSGKIARAALRSASSQ
jgi:acyl-coenzyme A synthetase/AMP-(fatty) acid ligase